MYVHKISLRNIRGFESLDFDLKRPDGSYAGWTVFTGDNGSGKSTLLKAIAVGLVGKDTARALQPNFNGWVRHGKEQEESSLQLELVRCEKEDDITIGGAPPNNQFPAKIVIKNGGKETVLEAAIPAKKPKGYQTPERGLWATNASGWFACGYGPFRRVFGASPEAMQQMVSSTTARFATMFNEAASLKQADDWLRDLQYKALENKATEKKQQELILRMLRDDLMPNQITIDRVDSDGLWLRDRKGLQLSWGEMSDGYRAALALLTDILRHVINTFGIVDSTEEREGKLVITRSGVVLIDEIDAHLHPEWQQKIGFWLKQHFPNIQFLVTTHSPIICQAADPNGLFVLPEPGSENLPRALSDEDYKKVIASRPDTILLTPAFGLQNTRSPRAVEGRKIYAKLAAKKQAGGRLSKEEKDQEAQFRLFAETEEEA